MDLIQLFFLALIQGLTEFLPISSSGHLVIFGYLIGAEDQNIIFANLKAEEMFGYSSQDLNGLPIDELLPEG